MSHPTEKKCGPVSVSVDQHGFPYWTRLSVDGKEVAILGDEELRDLHYALTRIVSYLDAVSR